MTDGFLNTVDAIRYVLTMFDASLSFVFHLVDYLPAIIGSAVILFVAVYVVRWIFAR